MSRKFFSYAVLCEKDHYQGVTFSFAAARNWNFEFTTGLSGLPEAVNTNTIQISPEGSVTFCTFGKHCKGFLREDLKLLSKYSNGIGTVCFTRIASFIHLS